MYLGVVSNTIIKQNEQTLERYALISLCDRANKLTKITLKNAKEFKIGDLLFVKIDEDGVYNFEKVPDLVFDKDSRLDEIFLFQFFNLIDEETKTLKKEKMYQESKQDELIFKVLSSLFGNFTFREFIIETLRHNFICYAKNIKLDLNDIKKYLEIQCMKIIIETQSSSFNFENWLNSVTLILYLSNNNDIDEELLTRAIESLLNVKIVNNETNELKLQLEQQLKEKLNELKGKQKKLV